MIWSLWGSKPPASMVCTMILVVDSSVSISFQVALASSGFMAAKSA